MLTADVGSFPQNTTVFASDTDLFSAEFLTNLCFASFGGAAGFVDSTGFYATTLQAGESFFLFSNLPIINVGEEEEGLWQTPVPGSGQMCFCRRLHPQLRLPEHTRQQQDHGLRDRKR